MKGRERAPLTRRAIRAAASPRSGRSAEGRGSAPKVSDVFAVEGDGGGGVSNFFAVGGDGGGGVSNFFAVGGDGGGGVSNFFAVGGDRLSQKKELDAVVFVLVKFYPSNACPLRGWSKKKINP